MTNAELAILSLVAESPRHGYEIEQIIEQRGMREWTEIGFSSIYYLLKRLEQNGSIKSEIETVAGHGPARRVYRLTPAGLVTWHEGALRALSEPKHVTSPFLLGLSNLPGLPIDASVGALQKYSQQLEERLDHLLARQDAQPGAPAHVVAMFDFSRTMVRAELAWVQQWIQSNAG